MTLSSDHEILRGRRWSPKSRIAALLVSLPLLAYAPGFVLALPQGVATSLPFWAEAPDYTCSSSPARSLMVRVQPFTTPSKAAAPKGAGWDCARIKNFAEGDLVGSDPKKADAGARYVRIYTPSTAEKAKLPDLATPDDMSSRVVSLRQAQAQASKGAVAAGAPTR